MTLVTKPLIFNYEKNTYDDNVKLIMYYFSLSRIEALKKIIEDETIIFYNSSTLTNDIFIPSKYKKSKAKIEYKKLIK